MGADGTDIQALEDKAQLPCSDLHNFISILRPFDTVLLKPFLPKAETVSVPVQDLEYCPAPIAEYKEVAGKGVECQGAFHQNREAVYCLSHVCGSRGEKDPHIGRQINHMRPSTRTTRSKSSGSNPLPISTR